MSSVGQTPKARIIDLTHLDSRGLAPEDAKEVQCAIYAEHDARQRILALQATAKYTVIGDQPRAKLNTGYDMPLVGLGTWWVSDATVGGKVW